MRIVSLFIICVAMVSLCNAQNNLNQLTLEPFSSGFNAPVGIYNAGDDRLFILEQNDADIEIVDNTGAAIGKFLDLTGIVGTGGERGLLGLAFHPDYTSNGKFYVNYTNTSGNTVIAEYSVSADPNIADVNSGVIIMTINQDYSNHNGGHIAFGPDGYLYIGMGDGGSAGDPNNRAQSTNSHLGKMLRISVTGNGTYTVPSDNPFVSDSAVLDEIWSIGLRNPWKFSFDSSTGDMWIGDVGQGDSEEINFEPAGSSGGLNYGWKCMEGTLVYDNTNCGGLVLTDPVAEYLHSWPDGPCSITGGMVYRGAEFENMIGHYLLTDYCDGKFYSLYPDGNGGFEERLLLETGIFGYVSIGSDNNGELYTTNVIQGTVHKLTDPCDDFSVSISASDTNLLATAADEYEWYLNGNVIVGADASSYTPAVSGVYYCTGSTNDGCSYTSNSISLSVGGIYVEGCTNVNAINFNMEADIDDGSCSVTEIECPGDFDGNGSITAFDLSQFLGVFGTNCFPN